MDPGHRERRESHRGREDRHRHRRELVGEGEDLVLVHGHVRGSIDEAGMQVDERRAARDHEGEGHERGDDGEREAEERRYRHAQEDGHGEGHENRGEGPARAVKEEVQDHDEEAEEGKVAVAGFPRLLLEVGRDEGLPEAADPAKGRARGRDRGLDPGQGRVALLGGMNVEAQSEAQEVVPEQGLSAEERRAGQESAESGRAVGADGDAGPQALRERQGADRDDAGHPGEGLLERAQGGQGRGLEGIVRLREEEDGGRLGEDALERAGRGVVLV